MSWVDWILRPFRGRPAEADAPPASSPSASGSPAQKTEPNAEQRAKAEKPAVGKSAAVKSKTDRPAAERSEKRNKKARKRAQKAQLAPPARQHPQPEQTQPSAEILPIEEAERRYAALVAPKPPAAEPAPEAPPVKAESEPPPPLPAQNPAEEARRAAAAENRRRARLPQFRELLSRASALLSVAEVEPRHLVSARRSLTEGWNKLGRPPQEDQQALTESRDKLLSELDTRLEAAAAVAEAENQAKAARRWAIVEEAHALAEREDLKGAGPAMGELRAKLRAIGKADAEDPAIIAFSAAEARLKQRQEQIRTDRDEHRREQLAALEQLVSRAEALAKSADPEAAAERIKALQATWKTIRVPGPRTEPDAAWAKFRTACDAVFAARQAARAEASRATLERMEAIIRGVEALAEEGTGDPDEEIAKARTAWRRAGRAPREQQQQLWERLQRAFDALRAPVELGPQDDTSLNFRPFEGLVRGESQSDDAQGDNVRNDTAQDDALRSDPQSDATLLETAPADNAQSE